MTGADSGRRYAIVVGVSHYEEPFSELPEAVEDAERVAALFTTLGYERALPEISADPTSAELLEALRSWNSRARLGSDDVVVAYFSGHGVLDGQRHYLLGSDAGENVATTAIPGSDFVSTVANSLAGNTLVIIDACYAGAAGQDLARSPFALGGAPSAGSGGTWVLAAAQSTELAQQGAMASALEQAIAESSAGKRQRYLGVDQVTAKINRYFADHGIPQSAVAVGWGLDGESPFFPNPAYVPDLPRDPLDIPSVVRLRREQNDHFLSRGRGVTHPSEPGDFFTGRVPALTAVADWLGAPRDAGGLLVVTGGAGSGKSSLLGRCLALTDLDSSARLSTNPSALPPTDLSVIAMACSGGTVEDVAGDLAAALDSPSAEPRDVLATCAARTDPIVIMLDGLDESADSGRLITEVVRPLSTLAAVRLVVGARSPLPSSLSESADVIDLDAPEFRDDGDLRAYVQRLLTSQEGERSADYRARPEFAAATAEMIVRRSGGSFLIAQLAANALLHGPGQVMRAFRGTSPRTTTPFTRLLASFGPDRDRTARLLLPLAYAQGEGLPRVLWAPLAEALTGAPDSAAEVDGVLAQGRMDAVLTASDTPDGVAYRFFHQTFQEYLRAPGDGRAEHRLISEALVRQVPTSATGERDWSAAHHYVREHLATHAAAGHVLDELLRDDGYLRHAASKPLLHALLETREGESELTDQVVGHLRSESVTVLVIATEWASGHGGLSTFNRNLCLALAAVGATVYCAVVEASDAEIADAAAKDVTLLCHPGAPGAPDYGRLTRRPALPPGVEPDLIIGHARTTGPAAAHVQEDFFPRARRLHIVHMAPDEIEWHKHDDATTRSGRADERTEIERRLGSSAHRVLAVGPRLYGRFRNELADADCLDPLRIDPGFDLPEGGQPAQRRPPPGNPYKVLMMGRTEDADLKGVDLGARACGLVHELRTKASTDPIELVVRGAPLGKADLQQERIREWSGVPGLDVIVREYTSDPRQLDGDMGRASLVIMPSRREGFGLVGLEAIIRGVPLLVSQNSGLALLLREFVPVEAAALIVPVTRNDVQDADTWSTRIEQCLADRDAAFTRMTDVRASLAARVTWAAAAEIVLGEALPR